MKKNFLAKHLAWLLAIVTIAAISLTLMAPPPPPPPMPSAAPPAPKLGGTPADQTQARAGLLGQINAGTKLKPTQTVVKGNSGGGKVADPSNASSVSSGKAGQTSAAQIPAQKPAGKEKILLDFDEDFPKNTWEPKQKIAINTAWTELPDTQKPGLKSNPSALLAWAEGVLAPVDAKKPILPSTPKQKPTAVSDLAALTTSLAALNSNKVATSQASSKPVEGNRGDFLSQIKAGTTLKPVTENTSNTAQKKPSTQQGNTVLDFIKARMEVINPALNGKDGETDEDWSDDESAPEQVTPAPAPEQVTPAPAPKPVTPTQATAKQRPPVPPKRNAPSSPAPSTVAAEESISIEKDSVNSTTIINWSKDSKNKKWLAGEYGQKWIKDNQKWLKEHNLDYLDSVIKKASAV